jgi:hypothetical protein
MKKISTPRLSIARTTAVEVERGDAGVPQEAWGRQDIFSTYAKRGMQRDALWRGSGGPEPEHRLAVGANPKERSLMIPGDVRQREANDVAIETNRHVEVADGEVHFEQIARFNHHECNPRPRYVTHGRLLRERRSRPPGALLACVIAAT